MQDGFAKLGHPGNKVRPYLFLVFVSYGRCRRDGVCRTNRGTGNFLHKSSVIQKCLEFVETDMDVPITSVCKAGVNVFCSVVIGEARGTGSAVSILAGLDAPPSTIYLKV